MSLSTHHEGEMNPGCADPNRQQAGETSFIFVPGGKDEGQDEIGKMEGRRREAASRISTSTSPLLGCFLPFPFPSLFFSDLDLSFSFLPFKFPSSSHHQRPSSPHRIVSRHQLVPTSLLKRLSLYNTRVPIFVESLIS